MMAIVDRLRTKHGKREQGTAAPRDILRPGSQHLALLDGVEPLCES
jgi:hypothetical protein